MNSGSPPALVCSPSTLPIDCTGPFVRQIGIPSGVGSLVTSPPDLYRPDYEHPNENLDGLIGYQRMALGLSDHHAESMVEQAQRSKGSQADNSVLDRALSGYSEHPRGDIDRALSPNYATRPIQHYLSVPPVSMYEFSEFYPKPSSPKAAIIDLHTTPSDVLYCDVAGVGVPMPSHAMESKVHNLRSFGSQATEVPRSIAMRYGMKRREEPGFERRHSHLRRESVVERTTSRPGISPNSNHHRFNLEFQGPQGSSVESLVQRNPHHNIGGRRKPHPYTQTSPVTLSPGLGPSEHAASGYWSLSPYATSSPSRSSLGSASPLTISPALSSTSARLDPDTVTGAIMNRYPSPHLFSNMSHWSFSQQDPTIPSNGTNESQFHRATAFQTLGVGVTSTQPPGNFVPTTVIPRLLVSPSAVPASSSIQGEMARFLSVSFQDPANWWRRMVLETILQSTFLQNDDLEPLDKGTSDPITMGFGKQGRSIYGVFVEEFTKGQWKCLFGTEPTPCPNNAVFKRFERAVEHVRSHLNHRPFKCDGSCNPGTTTCQRKFFAHQYLRDHLTRKEKTPCSLCGRSVLTQNISRHNQLRHAFDNHDAMDNQ